MTALTTKASSTGIYKTKEQHASYGVTKQPEFQLDPISFPLHANLS